MDDRILILPLSWAPDPAVFEKWPAVKALLSRLRSFLPVDIVLWPTLRGQKVVGKGRECMVNSLRPQLRSQHHVLAFASSEWLLMVLAERPLRSFVASGFYPSADVMAARGETALAAAMTAIPAVLSNPSQFMRLVMDGAEAGAIERAAAEVQRTFDRALQESIWLDDRALLAAGYAPWANPDFHAAGNLSVPTLYLNLPLLTPGREAAFDYFRSFVPAARHDDLHEWGFHLHEEAGGHELADKIIPFIQDVIAARKKG